MFTTFTTYNRAMMCVQENRTRQRSGGYLAKDMPDEGLFSRLHEALLRPNRNMSNIVSQWAKYMNRGFIKEDVDIEGALGMWE